MNMSVKLKSPYGRLFCVAATFLVISSCIIQAQAIDCNLKKNYMCSNQQKCIPKSYVCNGEIDCADKDDELNCGKLKINQ